MAAESLESLSALGTQLSEDERLIQHSVRRFVEERYMPRAAQLFAEEAFPRDLIPELASLGVLGASIQGYGCAGMTPVQYGLVLQELEYGDSGLRSFVSVQGSLAMYAISAFGDAAQKERFLPRMARGECIGCFGLTEPDSGSDPGSMKTRARRDGSDYVLTGTKMWITNAPFADVAVVWAKTDDQARLHLGLPSRTRHEGLRDSAHSRQDEPSRQRNWRDRAGRVPSAARKFAGRQAWLGRALALSERSALRHRLGRAGRGQSLLRVRALVHRRTARSSAYRSRRSNWCRPSSCTWPPRSSKATCSHCTLDV